MNHLNGLRINFCSRSVAIGFVMLRSHVEEKQDDSVCIAIPGSKTRNDSQHRMVLLGEDAAVPKLNVPELIRVSVTFF